MKKIETNPNSSINVTTGNTEYGQFGLTKREYFASLAMQGLVSQQKPMSLDTILDAPKNIAGWAVIFADELIKSLNEQK